MVKDQIRVLKEHLRMIKGVEAIKDDDWLSLDSEQEDAKSEDTSPSAVTEDTDDTLVEEVSSDQTMEEVRVDLRY